MLRTLPALVRIACTLGLQLAGGSLQAAPLEAPWSLPALTAKPEALLQAAKALPAPKEGDIEMLFEEHLYRLDDHGGKQSSVRRVYRYLTQKGVEDSSCSEANWSAWCEDKPEFHVRVISPDGQVHALDPQSIGEAPLADNTPDLLSDDKLLRAPLPAIEVGAIVEEEVVSHQTKPFFERGEVERILLADTNPIRKLRIVIDAPSAVPLKYEVLGIADMKPQRSEAGGRVQLVFETGPSKGRELPEAYMPSNVCRWPQLVFSTGKSWNDVAVAYSALIEQQLDVEAVRGLVRDTLGATLSSQGKTEPTVPEADRVKVITKLLAALRAQVRYTGVEFGKAAIVPRSPKETLGRRYGDCKDQATMLVAMLRVVGIPAHVALLRTGQYFDVVPSLPGLGDFDHAIVYVPGEHPLWIDTTARCTLPGQLPLTDQARWAMVVDPKTDTLIHTARNDYRENTSKEVFELRPTDRGHGKVRIIITGSGASDEDTREQYATDTPKNIRKVWRNFLKDQFHTTTLGQIEYLAPLDLTKPFHVVVETPDAKLGEFDGNRATITLQPDLLFDRLPGIVRGVPEEDKEGDGSPPVSASDDADAGDRKSPLELPEPHIREIQFRVVPPPGFVAKALPPNSVKQFGPASFSQKFQVLHDKEHDGEVMATFKLDTGPGLLQADDVNALRDAIVELGKDEESPWEVKILMDNAIEKQIADGKVGEALAAATAMLHNHADQAEYHIYQSQLLLKAGLGDAARREAARAVELAPRSADAYANQARVLSHDLFGQHFRAGMDWSGAAQAYVKAMELEPGEVTNRMDWAILLEHNAQGFRYGDGARLDDAVAEYRKAQKQLGLRNHMEQLDLNLGLALLYTEKYGDLEKLAVKSAKSDAFKALAVCAYAAKDGVSAADRKAAQLARDGDERRSILRAAAEYAHGARLYQQAGALLDLAADGAADASELQKLAKTYASRRRFTAADVAPAGPQRVVQQLFLYMAGGASTSDVQSAKKYFAADASDDGVAEVFNEVRRIIGPTMEIARQSHTPPQRAADLLSEAEFHVEGNAAESWRVASSNEKFKNAVWHVVVEEGVPKLFSPATRIARVDSIVKINVAWNAVLQGNVDKQALDSALAAAEESGSQDIAVLNTLAAVYAEQGDTLKALENLRASVRLRGDRTRDADWYILGRIAEDYHLNDEAVRLYQKVRTTDDVFQVAQRRLKKLGQ
jgi:hypothetical protein